MDNPPYSNKIQKCALFREEKLIAQKEALKIFAEWYKENNKYDKEKWYYHIKN